jgi:hypothetical protein
MKHPVSTFLTATLAALLGLAMPALCDAQSVSASEREALVRLRIEKGGRAEDVDALLRVADEAAARKLPAAPLTNKIREGLAKGVDPSRIEAVVRGMASQLDAADRLIREMDLPSGASTRDASVALLAESFSGGVTQDEVRELRRAAQPGSSSAKPALSSDSMASAARGLSFIKDSRLPVADGSAVMAEAMRQGFRSQDILDLGREIKRREADYRAGRASLRALRDAIARGERPEQLFRDARVETVTRPAAARPEATRPDAPVERPVARPETPQRPEQPVRPERPATTRDR